jgi:hypothetical protein
MTKRLKQVLAITGTAGFMLLGATAPALAANGPQYGTIGRYGEVWRGGGFDATAYDGGKYDKPLTSGRFIDPVGFAVDTHDTTTGGDGTALYVLDRTSNLSGNVTGGVTTWRLQKLSDRGKVLGTDQFSLPADDNVYEMDGLAVDPVSGDVYALLDASDPDLGVEYTDEILAWSTKPSSGKLVAGGLGTDTVSTGINGYATPGVLSNDTQLVPGGIGNEQITYPQGLALDVVSGTHYLAIQSADDSGVGDASGIGQVSEATGDINYQWSSSALDGLPNDVGESGFLPLGISTAPNGSLTVLLDDGGGAPAPQDVDVVNVPADLQSTPTILSSPANQVTNADLASPAVDGTAIYTADAAPVLGDSDGITPGTETASPQIVTLSNGLYAAEFEPNLPGKADPQNPAGKPGVWTVHNPGIRLLAPEAANSGALSNINPPLASLFDTLGNPTVNSTGATAATSACNLSDAATAARGNTAGPFPSLAAGANGTLWVLTRGTDSSQVGLRDATGGRRLIELSPKAGDPCPGPSGTFKMGTPGRVPVSAGTTPLTIQAGTTVTFSASSIAYHGAATDEYVWKFGDGKSHTVLGSPSPPFKWPVAVATHQYTKPGTFTVSMTLMGDYGKYLETGTVDVLAVNPPVAAFTYSPLAPHAGSAVTFNASGSKPSRAGASIIDYHWVWGDGRTDDTPTSKDTHTYTKAGKYTVTLTVRDSTNAQSRPTSHTITVGAA